MKTRTSLHSAASSSAIAISAVTNASADTNKGLATQHSDTGSEILGTA